MVDDPRELNELLLNTSSFRKKRTKVNFFLFAICCDRVLAETRRRANTKTRARGRLTGDDHHHRSQAMTVINARFLCVNNRSGGKSEKT